jgi:hypothetical protein
MEIFQEVDIGISLFWRLEVHIYSYLASKELIVKNNNNSLTHLLLREALECIKNAYDTYRYIVVFLSSSTLAIIKWPHVFLYNLHPKYTCPPSRLM